MLRSQPVHPDSETLKGLVTFRAFACCCTVTYRVQKMNRDEGQVRAKREAAATARRLSTQLTAAEDRDRLLAAAAELDAEADALERRATAAPPGVTQMQMQVQQAPPLKDEEDHPQKN